MISTNGNEQTPLRIVSDGWVGMAHWDTDAHEYYGQVLSHEESGRLIEDSVEIDFHAPEKERLAAEMGTSIQFFEKHFGKLRDFLRAAK